MRRFLLVPVSLLLFTVITFAQNNSLQFNGNAFTGPYVNVSTNSDDFNFGNTFTLEAWVYPTAGSNGNQTIVSKGGGNGGIDNSYIFQIQSGTLQFYNAASTASPYWFNTGVPIPNNVWTYVAVTYSNPTLKVFVNGSLIYTQSVVLNMNPGTNDFYIGRQGNSCLCNKFYGQIDEVRVWNIARSNTEIYNSFNKDLTGTESGLVAYYQFNQGIANGTNTAVTTLTDIAGTPNNGTLNTFALSGTLSNWVNGVQYLNNALNFDGVNDIVDVPYNSQLNLNANPFTIEYWARPTLVDGTNHWVLNKGTGNSDVDYLLGITSNNKFTFIARNLGIFFNGTSTPVVGNWYHVANVFDGSSAKIYVNGVLEATSTTLGTASTNTTGLRIGARTESGVPTQYFQGDIDEIRIWNIALSQNEIQNNRSKNVTTTTPGLVAYYEFNQGIPAGTNTAVNTAIDDSGNNFTGTLTNFGLTAAASNWVSSTSTSTTGSFTFDPPVITGISPSLTICSGFSTTVTVAATGSLLSYQWYTNGSPIPGQTSATLTISGSLATASGTLFAVVSRGVTSLTSSGISLSVGCNNALDFDGVDDFVQLPSATYFPNNNYTVETWVYPRSLADQSRVLDFGNGSYAQNVFITLTAGTNQPPGLGIYPTTSGAQYIGVGNLPLNTWTHLAVVSSGTNAYLYINGVLNQSFTGVISVDNMVRSLNYIGKSNWANAYTNGILDELRIWNTSVSQADINNNKNRKPVGNELGLIAYYDFDQGIASGNNSSVITLIDRTSNNYTGTLTGFAKSGSGSNFVISGIPISGNYIVGVPTITGVSSSLSVCSGATATLSITALGTNLSYQWYKNGSIIAGQTFSTLTLTSGLTTSSGTILAVVSNAAGTVTSSGISLGVGCNNALDLNGALDFINIANMTPYSSITNQFTYETWIYHTGVVANKAFLIGNNGYSVQWNATGDGTIDAYLVLSTGGGIHTYSTGTIPANTWTHLAYTYNKGQYNFYINGLPAGAGTIANSTLVTPTQIGFGDNPQVVGNVNLSSKIDEVKIWNIALSSTDVLNNYTKKPTSTTPGLVAYYDFDQGIPSGINTGLTSVLDRSSYTNNGVFTNGTLSGPTSNWVASGATITGSFAFAAPSITGVSSSLNVCSGATATLSATALGTNLNYQWYKNGSAISGQTFSTLTLTSGLTTSPGTILAVVYNMSGSVTSSGISLGVGCNNALDFDGIDDRITNTYSVGQIPTGNQDWTFQTWAYYKGGQTGDKWFAWWGTATLADQEVIFGINASNNTLKIDRYSPDNRALSTPMPLNTWTHLSYTYTGANRILKVYVNGALTNTINDYTSDLNISSIGTFELGTFQSSTLFNSNIILDEVRLFNVALSDADINLSKNSIVSSTTPNLALYYDFNQGVAAQNNSSETVLLDRTSNPLNLTLTNFGLNGSSSNWVNTNITLSGAFNFLPPTISGITSSQTICSGVVTTFSVTASGTNLSYQWYKNGSAISGQIFSTLTLVSGLTTSAGTLFAVVSNIAGTVTSAGISLGVACNTQNAISFNGAQATQPISIPALSTTNPAFTMEAWVYPGNGGSIKYTPFCFSNIGGNTGKFFVQLVDFSGVSPYMNIEAYYYNGSGTNVSSIIPRNTWSHIAVSADPVSGDLRLFLNGSLISSANVVQSIDYTSGAAVKMGEQVPGGENMTGYVDELRVWQGTRSNGQIAANFATTLPSTTPGLLVNSTFDYEPSSTAFTNKSTGSAYNLNGALYVPNYTFTGVPTSISGLSPNASVCVGSNLNLTVTAVGTTLAYQWFKNSSALSGQTLSTLSLVGINSTSAGNYFVVVNGYNGTVTSTGIALTVTTCNNALNFDGIDDVVSIPYNSGFDFTNKFTIETWVNTIATTEQYLCLKTEDSWFLSINSVPNKASIWIYGLTGGWFSSTSNVNDGNWHHIAVTYDGAFRKLYFDGVLENSQADAGNFSTGTSPVVLGKRGGFNLFKGSMDELRLWNVAQPQSTIRNNIVNGITGSEAGLVSYYNFNSGTPNSNNAGSTSLKNSSSISGINGQLNSFGLNGNASNWIASPVPILGNPTITGLSTAQTICSGASTTMTVGAIGMGLIYQWLRNGIQISGQTSPTLTLSSGLTTAPGTFSVIVESLGGSLTSTGITLSLLSSTGITNQPVASTICGGNTNVFSVIATGSGLNYIWSNGATTPSITVSGIGNYTVTVSGTCGTAISNTVSLSTLSGTTITTQPTSSTICGGNTNVFSVSAAGSGLTYLWSNGATTPSITVSGIGNYTATVSGTCGAAVSSTVSLSTISGTTILSQPISATICGGNTKVFSVSAAGSGLTYLWSNGATTPSITASGIGNYIATVSGTCGTAISNTVSLSTISGTTILSQPISATICGGNTKVFSVSAAGSGLSYLWSNGAITPGITVSGIGNYTATVSGTCGTAVSNSVSLSTISGTAITTQPTSATICGGNMNVFTVSAAGSGLTYLWSNGATTPSITVSGIGNYTSTVSGTCGTVISNTVSLSTLSGTSITAQPTSATICGGSFTTLSIAGSGNNILYQWNTGANSSSIIVSTAGIYQATVSGTCGLAVSNPINIAIENPLIGINATSTLIGLGQSVVLSGTGAVTYTFTGGVINGIGFSPSATNTYSVAGTTLNGCIGKSDITITVTVAGTNIVSITPSITTCLGSTIKMVVSATGNNLFYDWYYNNGLYVSGPFANNLTIPSLSNGNSGTYFVVVSGSNGTVTSSSINIGVQEPTVSANISPNVVCLGSVVTLAGNGALTYTVSGGVQEGIGFVPAATSTYTVTGADNLGCKATTLATVTVFGLPLVGVVTPSTEICYGNTTSLGGTGALTYSWSNGIIDGAFFTPTISGVYTVTGIDGNGCSNQSTSQVTVNALPSVGINASSNVVCAGSEVTLSGIGALTYTWSGGVPNGVGFIPSATATYSVTGIDGNLCSNSAVTTINVVSTPTVSGFSSSNNICIGQTVTLTGAGAQTYSWSNGVSDGVPFVPSATNIYTVTGIAPGGCFSTSTVQVVVNPLPTVSGLAVPSILCIGGQATLTGSGAITYSWSNGALNGIGFTPTVSGIYTVTGIDGNACSQTAQVPITVNPLPSVGINASSTVVCAGNQVTLAGTGALTYNWSDGVSNNIGFTPINSNAYTVSGTDLNGCVNYATTAVSVSPPVVLGQLTTTSIGYGQPISEVLTTSGIGPFTYSVSSGTLPNGIALDASTGTFSGFASLIGNYSFTVALTNGSCGDSKPFSLQVTKGNLTVQVLDTSIYGSQPTPISFLSSVTGLRPGETLNYVYNTSAPANNAPFGDYPISVIVSGSTLVNYNLTVNGGTLHVLPLIGLTVTASNFTREYGQPNPIFTSTIVGLNPNDRVTISYITSANSLSGLSTYPIYPQVSGLDAYKYSKTLIPGNLTIKAARLTIKASDAYLVAGSVIPTTFPGIVTGLVLGDDITVRNTVDITTSTVLGVYQITPEVEGTSLNNYTLIMFPGNLYIKYGLTVAAMNFTRNYGQSNPTYTGTVTGIQPNGTGVTVRYTSGVIGSTPVGGYAIDPKVSGSDADKYVITTISGVYTILPAPLTVAANNFVKLQGDPNPVFASTVYGLINGESLFINYFTSADQTSPAGQYSVIPDPSGTTLSNYNLTTVAGVLTIGTTTSNLSVTVGNYSRVYGDPDPVISGTINGLKSGDDVHVSFTSNTNASSPVGIYPISINVTGTDITKYTISTVAGTLTITSAPLIISANSYSKAYMDTIPTFSGSIVGLKNGENLTVTYQTGASQISNVGNYPIVPSVPTSSILSNYKLTVNNGALAITKVNLTVIGANLSRPFGQSNPQLSYNLLGFVNGENITVIDKIPEGRTVAESNSSTGTYTITYFGGIDNNYDFTYGNGILTVAKASQTILVASLNANVSTGNTLGVTALASSGLPLTLTSLDTTILKVVNGLQILGVADGSTSLIISQSGNANYDAAPSITITGISTSTGVVAPSVIGVIGSNEVVPNSPVTYSMPYKVGYTYLWVYTGTNINWLESKKDSNVVKVLFTQVTATNVGGQMIGKMFDPQGNLVKTDSIPIAINTSEDAQIAAILSQQLAPVKCAPVITDCANAYILSFNLGKRVRNKSGCSQSGFGDYTTFGKVDTLIMGASYQLKASAINTKSAASFFAIWIDYGNDGSFEDPDDFVRASFKTDSVFEVNNVIIRNNDDYIGPRRVRVSMRTSGAFVQSQSCPEEGTVGETEDYLIYIRKQDALEAPSAITPNDDGKNDLFIVRGVNPKLDNKLTILDRLGKKVFEQTDYQNDWGGKDSDGNKLEDGTYFYFFTNGNVQIRGFVEIKTR